MRNFVDLRLFISFFIFALSCKSKQQNIEYTELPAYQPINDSRVLKNILNSENVKNIQKLIIDNREYPVEDFQRITDTLKIDKYSLKIDNDSISGRKILILKSS